MTHRTTTNASTPSRIHLVWDWNGTVRDDLDDHVAALNATLPRIGGPRIDVATYRALHAVPIRSFYDALVGRTITDEEWSRSNAEFLDVLHRRPVRLRAGVRQLMLGLRAAGHRQSLLSLAPHARLLTEVAKAGIGGLLERVDGRTGEPAHSKAPALAAHLSALGVEPGRALVIGDSLDDAVAAEEVGAVAVLHTGGLHSTERLAAAGVPLADSLREAVETGIALLKTRQGANR
ncbi:HAD-IA family hydrolase [Kitasatospora saccharophila]|uniref:HAD-IA family hydrolase n=1 Tax=Kitasatospora saccharophila TaxID=407973 RepID=A0ABN2XZL0_9ACTN